MPPPPVAAPPRPGERSHPVSAPPPPAGDAGKTNLIKVGMPTSSGVVAVLIGVDGKLRDEVYKVFDGENTLGRDPAAQVHLGDRDDAISREHAKIIHREGAFGLQPLKEDNPTFLNGEIVEGGAALSDGDEIGVGDSKLRFRKA